MIFSENSRQKTSNSNKKAPCLKIAGLSVVRGQRLVIDSLDHIQEIGELCLVTGSNGAGKSTLLRTIAGRLPIESGHIICNLPCFYLGHTDGLSGFLSGRKNLQSWVDVNKLDTNSDDIDQALSWFNTTEFADTPVQLLSRGQRASQ